MYSAVYKCVCKHHSETLHMDLIQHVEGILKDWNTKLSYYVMMEERQNFIQYFNEVQDRFEVALASIVPIFTYLVKMITVDNLTPPGLNRLQTTSKVKIKLMF